MKKIAFLSFFFLFTTLLSFGQDGLHPICASIDKLIAYKADDGQFNEIKGQEVAGEKMEWHSEFEVDDTERCVISGEGYKAFKCEIVTTKSREEAERVFKEWEKMLSSCLTEWEAAVVNMYDFSFLKYHPEKKMELSLNISGLGLYETFEDEKENGKDGGHSETVQTLYDMGDGDEEEEAMETEEYKVYFFINDYLELPDEDDEWFGPSDD